jgi:hypothetical protein
MQNTSGQSPASAVPRWRRGLARHQRGAIALAGLTLLVGCSTKQLTKSADKQVYGLIQSRGASVADMDRKFTLENTNQLSLAAFPVNEKTDEALGEAAKFEQGAHILTLKDALGLGVNFSRAYQTARDQLYLTALTLTLAQHRFTPLFTAAGNVAVSGQAVPQQVTEYIPDPLDPTKVKAVLSDTLVEQNRVRVNGAIRMDWLIRDVGRITAAFVADFTRIFSGGVGTVSSSQVGATFSRPLLRNAGFLAEQDVLTQAEHDLLYGIRDFTRFRKDFTVQIASDYYQALGNRDTVRNVYLALQGSRQDTARARELAKEGRMSQADLARYEQQLLNAESAWIDSVRAYLQALDGFKVRLGLPADAQVMLDARDLEQLAIMHPDVQVHDAIELALTARLDYQNAQGRVEDADRRVKLAINNLKPQVDFVAGITFNSDPNSTSGFALPELDRYQWNAGLDVDVPLDRLEKRNAYRSAVINQGQVQRAKVQLHDEIELEVRDTWRVLEQARRTYQISEISVELAKRRVENQEILASLGRANALDQVDAQKALVESRNERTRALVAHTIARLRFWNSLGVLYVQDNGQWQEIPHAPTK